MAFRKKINSVYKYDADIIVIQESESVDKIPSDLLLSYPHQIWEGENKNKGILILTKENINIKINEKYKKEYKYIIPINVETNKSEFCLLAIWAQDDKLDPTKQYIGQIWLALHDYIDLLNQKCIIVGDFNSNSIWDNGTKKIANHSQVVSFLNQFDIKSIYHQNHNARHGAETIKTLAFRKNLLNLYHIDYCFASRHFYNESSIIIGDFSDWIDKSDHVPLIIHFSAIS